jgi:quercetin dioxygenase-like cupin family protein
MGGLRPRRWLLLAVLLALLPAGLGVVAAQDKVVRTELRRADLTGSEGTEVIMTLLKAAPGARLPRHVHHGDEFLYVIRGGAIEEAGGKVTRFEPGATLHFPRAMPHGGFVVVGEETIEVITTHIVDKGKPFAVPVE